MAIEPLAWKDRPSLIEYIFPAQKISAEAQKERKAGAGQTLTTLGSYWKGRKPLILNKACILGALLPATNDPESDLAIFELLMAIDDDSFVRRLKSQRDAHKLPQMSYLERLDITKRPEECDSESLYGSIWQRVNQYLGTAVDSFPELIEQLGVLRFGHKPKVADTFCGSGQIPFEAARLGCDVYASDLNPIACMLTWGALHIVGADETTYRQIECAQREMLEAVDSEICRLQIEHDSQGNRAKAYLYCLEARCPQTGWMVPMAPSWVISKTRKVAAKLVPDSHSRRFLIQVVSSASEAEMQNASQGTVRDGDLVYTLDGEVYRTPIRSLRGDYRLADGSNGNRLRRWDRHDVTPRPDDILQERLYCVYWMQKDTLARYRPKTFFASVTDEDVARERKVLQIVQENLMQWQSDGLVPDMPIEPGDETTRLERERGWTYWHHLFNPRQLLVLSLFRKASLGSAHCSIYVAELANFFSKLCSVKSGGAGSRPEEIWIGGVFANQALNTYFNYGCRSSWFTPRKKVTRYPINHAQSIITPGAASDFLGSADILVTDPPYADAVNYHEITEFFIAWLRKNPPQEFREWVWDSRRPLAIKGSGEDFRREMIAAYPSSVTLTGEKAKSLARSRICSSVILNQVK